MHCGAHNTFVTMCDQHPWHIMFLPAVMLIGFVYDVFCRSATHISTTIHTSVIFWFMMHICCLFAFISAWKEHWAVNDNNHQAVATLAPKWFVGSVPFMVLFTLIYSFFCNLWHLKSIFKPDWIMVVWCGWKKGCGQENGRPRNVCENLRARWKHLPAAFHPLLLKVTGAGQEADGTYKYSRQPHDDLLPASLPLLANDVNPGMHYYKNLDTNKKSIIYYDQSWKLSTSGSIQSHEYAWQLEESKPMDKETMHWTKSTMAEGDDKCQVVVVYPKDDWDLHYRAMHIVLVPVVFACMALYADAWAVRKFTRDGGPKVNCHCNITGSGTLSHEQEVCVGAWTSIFYELNMVLADFYEAWALRSLGVLVFEFLKRQNVLDNKIETYYKMLIDMFWKCSLLTVIVFYGSALLGWYVSPDWLEVHEFYKGLLSGCLMVGSSTTIYGLTLLHHHCHSHLHDSNFDMESKFITTKILVTVAFAQKLVLPLAVPVLFDDYVDERTEYIHAALLCCESACLVVWHCRQWSGNEAWYAEKD